MKISATTSPARLFLTLSLAFFASFATAQDLDLGTITGCPTGLVCLTTYQGGVSRRGFNPFEPTLTQSAIKSTTGPNFHLLRSVKINGAVYAQPLVLPNVVNGTITHSEVVYAATERDLVYAIDASTGNVIWQKNLAPSGYTYMEASDINNCINIEPQPGDVGVTGTPVIDISQNIPGSSNTITQGTLYVVAKTKTTTTPVTYAQWLYALSVIDGATKASIQISGTFNAITFDSGYSQRQNQRGALLALGVSGQNPQIIIPWGAHCDHKNFPYNGWLMAYQLNSGQSALAQTGIWASVPSDSNYTGGIWAGGSGPALFGTNIFFTTGNAPFNVNSSTPPNDNPLSCTGPPCNYGDSVMSLQLSGGSFTPVDFFTPFDWNSRYTNDYDLGSGGVMLLPHQSNGNPSGNLLAQAGKEGSIYLLRTDTGYLGGYNGGNTDQVVQYIASQLCYQINPQVECGVWGGPAWWSTTSGGGGSTGYAYFTGEKLQLMQFKFTPNPAAFATTPTNQSAQKFLFPGPTPAVSAPGTSSTLAIVWAIDSSGPHNATQPANLWAFDAATLSCLYTTDQTASSTCPSPGRVAPSTDVPAGIGVKFTVPSVANGNVYVGTTDVQGTSQGWINIYGVS